MSVFVIKFFVYFEKGTLFSNARIANFEVGRGATWFSHYVKESIAYSYLDKKFSVSNEKFQVEINGDFYDCKIIKEPLYDPQGTKMRS